MARPGGSARTSWRIRSSAISPGALNSTRTPRGADHLDGRVELGAVEDAGHLDPGLRDQPAEAGSSRLRWSARVNVPSRSWSRCSRR